MVVNVPGHDQEVEDAPRPAQDARHVEGPLPTQGTAEVTVERRTEH